MLIGERRLTVRERRRDLGVVMGIWVRKEERWPEEGKRAVDVAVAMVEK